MKNLTILFAITLSASFAFADKHSYSVTTNTSWSTANYTVNDGKASTFTISSGKTLTINQSGISCYECSFSGGNIAITSGFSCQSCSFTNTTMTMSNATLTLVTSLNTFSSVNFTVSGTGEILANAPVIISNSTFTFNNSSYLFNNGGTLAITASTLTFNNNSYLLANAGPVSLQNGTEIFIGNGLSTSNAYVKMNGPTLNIYDNSGISLGNDNNYYFNWSSYSGAATTSSASSSVSTSPNSLNCGGSFPNSCQSPLVYGPANLSASGLGTISVLPVLLTGFTAVLSDNAVTLTWNTTQETNSNYFEVERSQNGTTWEAIGTVSAKGNSATISEYSYNDNAPVNGINYYRLKMVNIDNSFNYSEVKTVRTTAVKEISFFPNPAQTFVNVSLVQSDNSSSVQLLNISGQILQETKVSGGNASTVTFNVAQYARGMYVVRVVNTDGSSATSKLVIAH
jgi:hypothetical protein